MILLFAESKVFLRSVSPETVITEQCWCRVFFPSVRSGLPVGIQLAYCLAVVFTFPLQLFPVLQIVEKGHTCGVTTVNLIRCVSSVGIMSPPILWLHCVPNSNTRPSPTLRCSHSGSVLVAQTISKWVDPPSARFFAYWSHRRLSQLVLWIQKFTNKKALSHEPPVEPQHFNFFLPSKIDFKSQIQLKCRRLWCLYYTQTVCNLFFIHIPPFFSSEEKMTICLTTYLTPSAFSIIYVFLGRLVTCPVELEFFWARKPVDIYFIIWEFLTVSL